VVYCPKSSHIHYLVLIRLNGACAVLNYIWFVMLVTGFVVGIMNGRVDEITQAVVDSSKNAVEISIGLLGIMCLWTGLMEVAESENPNWRKNEVRFTMMTMTNPYLLNTVQKKPEDLVANTVTPYRNII